MKKKLLTLFMALVLVFSNCMVTFAGEPLPDQPTEFEKPVDLLQSADGAATVAAISDPGSLVIDLRAKEDYAQAHIKGSVSLPVCLADYSVTTDQRDNFVNYVKANATADTKIYLVCYMGTFCVNYAAKWLTDPVDANGCGLSLDDKNIYRVIGGVWNDTTLAAACNSTHYDVALADTNGLIIDIRSNEKYEAGHVRNSYHQPLFGPSLSTGSDKLATDFNAFVDANKDLLSSKNVYVLCNAGASGANLATQLLRAKGLTKVYTIEGGATSGITAHFVKNEAPTVTEYKFVSSADAIKAMTNDEVVIIDVRTPANFAKGSITNINVPLFGANGVTNGTDDLAKAFTKYVTDNQATLKDKDIYILCNSGSRGAQAATQLLADAGYNVATTDEGQVYTIKGGATNIDIRYGYIIDDADKHTVSGDDAVAVVGNAEYVILDVRASGNYAAGHLKGSVSLPVFDGSTPVSTTNDELSKAFTKYVTDKKAEWGTKQIYILCNSGARGAQAATVLLSDAGYDLDNVATIKGGYNDPNNLEDNHVKENATYVSSSRVITALKNNEKDVVIIDVRSSKTQSENGTLKGSLSLPLFDANNKLDTDDAKALEEAFVKYVEEHKKDFEGKKIYILCNSGSRGAEKATKLLKAADLKDAGIFTIEGGAKDPLIAEALKLSLNDPSSGNGGNGNGNGTTGTTPKTGDTANVMSYALVMAISLLAIVTVSRKKFTK